MLCLFPSHVLQLLLLSFYTLKLCHFHHITLFPTLQCLLCSELLPNQSSSVSIQELWGTAFPSGCELCMIHPLAVLIQWQSEVAPGCFVFPVGWACALLPRENTDLSQGLQRVLCTLCCIRHHLQLGHHFSLPVSTAFVLPSCWEMPLECVWQQAFPPLHSSMFGLLFQGKLRRFFIKSPDTSPLVLSLRSYSSSQLLFWHSFSLHRARFVPPVNTADTTAIFFPSKRHGAGFCTYFLTGLMVGLWDSVGLGSWDPSGIWSYFTGIFTLQWVSWWSLKGIVGKKILCYRKKNINA